MPEQQIITAASKTYGRSLLALLGSLNLNWPHHPPVRVYDIGLDSETLNALEKHQIEVVNVPPFCPHWRKHFTWKIWCLNDAPARDILWLDAGIVVLKPLDEIFAALQGQGYFLVTNYQLLDWEASEAACKGCSVSSDFRIGKLTLAGGMMGFRKERTIQSILKKALAVALTEEHIAATEPTHRHEQAIISLLMYKHFGQVVVADGTVYLGWQSPEQTVGQKAWVHRLTMRAEDCDHFAAHIAKPGERYSPKDPAEHTFEPEFGLFRRLRMRFYHFVRRMRRKLGKTPPEKPPRIYDGVKD